MSAVRTSTRLVVGLVAGIVLLTLAAPAAQAQDPYGSTTTTVPTDRVVEATCGLSIAEGRVGATVVATVAGVFFGESVDILFDGVVVGSATAPDVAAQSASTPVGFGGTALPAQDAVSTTVKVTFSVPSAAAGNHLVSAVGDTFVCLCNPGGQFKVLAAATASKLPKTGIYVGVLLAVAVALLLGGRAFIAASRERRRTNAAFVLDEDDELTSSGHR